MKILFLLILFIPLKEISAQDSSILFKRVIKVYPLNILGGHINVGYEHVLNERRSFEINASYYFIDLVLNTAEEENFRPVLSNGFALRGSYRFYSKKHDAPQGFYFSPQLMYKYLKTNELKRSHQGFYDSIQVIKNVFAVKFLVGHQSQILSSRILADAFAGIGFRHKRVYHDQFYLYQWNRDLQMWVEEEPAGRMRINYTDTWVDYFTPSIHFGINFGIGISK